MTRPSARTSGSGRAPARRTVLILSSAAMVGTGLADWYGHPSGGWDVIGAFQEPVSAEAALAAQPSLVVVSACPDRGLVGAAVRLAGSAPLLVLVGRLDAAVEAGLLRAGAAGVLCVTVSRDELLAVSASLVRGRSAASAEAIRLLAAPAPRQPTLTVRQVEILSGLAHGRSTKELATELVLTESTVKTHIGRLATRLGVAGRRELETLARQLLADQDGALGPGAAPAWPSPEGRAAGPSFLPRGVEQVVGVRMRARRLVAGPSADPIPDGATGLLLAGRDRSGAVEEPGDGATPALPEAI